MNSSMMDEVGLKVHILRGLLPKDRTILEREMMEFRPFGRDEQGQTIRDLSGMSIRAVVVYLEKRVARERGAGAGIEAVEELCRSLNERIKNPVYHVTPEFLKNPWNSYSYEFTAYLYEFCERMTDDPGFVFNGGMEKASPIMQVLARPFSLAQIYGMFPYFGNKFASGSIECRVVEVTPRSATLAMRFSDRTLRQFGPFRRRCAHLMCQAAQGIMAAVPARVHGLPRATLTDVSCIANDDEWCEWAIRWQAEADDRWSRKVWRTFMHREEPTSSLAPSPVFPPEPANSMPIARPEHDPAISVRPHASTQAESVSRRDVVWSVGSGLTGAALATGVYLLNPAVNIGEVLLIGLAPVLIAGVIVNRHLRKESQKREALIQEQINFVESRHEELREAYLEQEQTRVELRRKVTQLTVLHRAGLLFSSTLDRETLLQQVLETLTRDLHYDRAMISFFDPVRGVLGHTRMIGVSPEVQVFAESREMQVTDSQSPEGMVVLQGRPLLIGNVRAVWDQLHPSTQQLLRMSNAKAMILVPMKTNDRLLGTLTVDRTHEHSLTEDDLELMTTLASQVAIALDNASAYQQIEEWNVGLELKVRERTAALEHADRLRSQFLSHVSHELKTPLTSIKGFIQNLLDGLTGPLNEKQHRYLSRMLDNSDRLIRMIEDLLDRTRIEAGRLELLSAELDLESCLNDAVEQLRPLAYGKRQKLDICFPTDAVTVWADRDRLIQVVMNLVQNAIKYTPEDGMITVLAESPNMRLARVLVRDTGPGIPAEYLEKIFDPFFRVQYGQRSGPKGLGLGLSIVKTLVELQGGQVSARNCPGGGAELSFTVPVLPSSVTQPAGVPVPTRKILVVDDDADIRQLLCDRLKAAGYQPYSAIDGRQALEALRADIFGGVILDIGIGQMDEGLDVLRQIRLWNQVIPIIMVTASGSRELAVQAIGMGAQAYLLKPFDAGELQQAMDHWFRQDDVRDAP